MNGKILLSFLQAIERSNLRLNSLTLRHVAIRFEKPKADSSWLDALR